MTTNNISIIWDFDGTLTPLDSTSVTIEVLKGRGTDKDFWNDIKILRGDKALSDWEHVLASDAPIWMYALSRMAFEKRVPLNAEFFKTFVAPEVKLFKGVIEFLNAIKRLERTDRFLNQKIKINHFIVSAGMKDLVEQCFSGDILKWVFGCRYTVTYTEDQNRPESIPVFCMDETMKTRSIFEIVKGTFDDPTKGVNSRVDLKDQWSPFQNIIYIGDGPTDVPALSLVRSRGGLGIVLFDRNKKTADIKQRLSTMSLDRRADFIVPADFSIEGELYKYISEHCHFILRQCEAANINTLI